MKGSLHYFLLILFLGSVGCSSDDDNPGSGSSSTTEVFITTTGFASPTSYPGMTLIWQDEFDGKSLDLSSWTHETGKGDNGWGNNELQHYRSQNTSVEREHLIITAKEESFSGSEYTSLRIITENKKQFRYGRIDIRAVMPKGQGLWPALWMLGSNFRTVGWPACGEIDIMEMIGGQGREKTVHGTVHWQQDGNRAQFGGEYSLAAGTLSDQFHVYSIEWDAGSIRWFIDNKQYHVIDTTPEQLDEFRRSFFLIFNVAVGGDWPGSPNDSTSFPQHMIVDYVRVFQKN